MQCVDIPLRHDPQVCFLPTDNVKQHILLGGAQRDIGKVGENVGDLQGLRSGHGQCRAYTLGFPFNVGSFRRPTTGDFHIRRMDVVADDTVLIKDQGRHPIRRIKVAHEVDTAFGGGQGHLTAILNGQLTLGNAVFDIGNPVQVVEQIDIPIGGHVHIAGRDECSILVVASPDNPVRQTDPALGLRRGQNFPQAHHKKSARSGVIRRILHIGGLDVHVRSCDHCLRQDHLVACIDIHVAVHRLEVEGVNIVSILVLRHDDHRTVACNDVQPLMFNILSIRAADVLLVVSIADADCRSGAYLDHLNVVLGVRHRTASGQIPSLRVDVSDIGLILFTRCSQGQRSILVDHMIHIDVLFGQDLEHTALLNLQLCYGVCTILLLVINQFKAPCRRFNFNRAFVRHRHGLPDNGISFPGQDLHISRAVEHVDDNFVVSRNADLPAQLGFAGQEYISVLVRILLSVVFGIEAHLSTTLDIQILRHNISLIDHDDHVGPLLDEGIVRELEVTLFGDNVLIQLTADHILSLFIVRDQHSVLITVVQRALLRTFLVNRCIELGDINVTGALEVDLVLVRTGDDIGRFNFGVAVPEPQILSRLTVLIRRSLTLHMTDSIPDRIHGIARFIGPIEHLALNGRRLCEVLLTASVFFHREEFLPVSIRRGTVEDIRIP